MDDSQWPNMHRTGENDIHHDKTDFNLAEGIHTENLEHQTIEYMGDDIILQCLIEDVQNEPLQCVVSLGQQA